MTQTFRNKEVIYLHDPLAVGAVINPDLVTKQRLAIRVEIREGDHYGETLETNEAPKIDVCLGVDAEKFLELFVSRLANQ
jgi:purine nucleosidase